MSKQLGGVLAVRHGWCRPDEVIRFAVPCVRSSIRYDISGLSWEGTSGGSAIGRVATAVEDLVGASSEHDNRLSPPRVVYSGPNPQAQIMQARPEAEDADVLFTWVLTSHRLALLAEVPEPAAEEGISDSVWQKARKFGAGVRDFSRDVVDILQDKKLGEYPPNAPVPVAPVAVRAEFPLQQVRAINRTTRRLPGGYAQRDVFALRIELGDGSVLEVISQTEEHAARLEAMAHGRQ
ncbi:hypothetical protein LZ318_40145 [Saccharopolyspora indica]|uniref:hypothetical protein n=1 Tax=Saccharopolyspora indica TaxID=1229659 RepID=UPI0022EB4D70|nr:hypothetical protein [Saccharopolyspora indica]MDA3650178.1 hypothetical protein [Saccharopolyspora indica]